MVLRSSFLGNQILNPFYFKDFGIRELTVIAGGVKYNREPLKMNFNENYFFRAYLQMMEAMGFGFPSNTGCYIPLSLFKNGIALFCFDLTPDNIDGTHWNLVREGPTAIDAHFQPGLDEAVELIAYAEYDTLVRIDRNHEVHTNYLT
jgi:hypothetical protein